ncbi:hypothetical protein niasHS_005845 [Heterodera schachtii]|uniref:Purple acid phosphatase n=1 Tax=Heterodera schachtii TaxID=97005 RepID=A0ABD2JZN1_HETSC
MGKFSRETPQQVHLSLTDRMNEMNISWLTFEDVETFVEYWHEDSKNRKERIFAKTIKHEFRDFMKDEVGFNSDQKLAANFRYMHTVTLEGLYDDSTYEYQVGHCDPKEKIAKKCSEVIRQEQILQTNGAHEIQRDKVFYFRTFPRHSAKKAFTIAIFGDMGLKRPEEHGVFEDQEGSSWKHADQIVTLPDTLAPHAMDSLMALVHPGHNDEHPVRKSHLNERSSGLRMTNVQLILHIGDIAYDMHEYRMKQKIRQEDEDEVYNLGDRFMQVVEDIAAYVPYMVIAGNHENEEKSADYHKKRREMQNAEGYEPQYEHFESRFKMPRNFKGHDTSQYYDFTYGPIWFICASTEYYYSYAVKSPTFRWVPDWENVRKQYEFIEHSLKKANKNRHKNPWVIALLHRPFYCTSINKVTCRFNKSHKHGLPTEDDPKKFVYGLEELFNKYNVDFVITGHEHIFEFFPPIELFHGMPKVVPDKFWWKVQRNAQHIDEENQEMVDTRHEFRTFTDPVAPVYLIVGRPGNAEEMEKLHPVPMLQRITYYNRFSFTLLHFPVDVTQSKSTLAIRQVDIETGDVPTEFLVEKTFANYEPRVLCAEIDKGTKSKHRMALSNLTSKRVQQKRNPYTKKWRKVLGKRRNGTKGERTGEGETKKDTKGLIRELLFTMNQMEYFGERDEKKRERIWRLKEQICDEKSSKKQKVDLIEQEKAENNWKKQRKEAEVNDVRRNRIERQEKPIGKEMIRQIERELRPKGRETEKGTNQTQQRHPLNTNERQRGPISRRRAWNSANDDDEQSSDNSDMTGPSAISSLISSSEEDDEDEDEADSHARRMERQRMTEVVGTKWRTKSPNWSQ